MKKSRLNLSKLVSGLREKGSKSPTLREKIRLRKKADRLDKVSKLRSKRK